MVAVYDSLGRRVRRTLNDLYLSVFLTTSDPVTLIEISMHLTECITGHKSLSCYLSGNVPSFVRFLNLTLVPYLQHFWTNSALPLL